MVQLDRSKQDWRWELIIFTCSILLIGAAFLAFFF
jgi:hypothetical protein